MTKKTDANVLELTDANFNAIIQSEQPVLVDFWAPWCGPCQMLTPIMEALAKDNSGKVIIGKLNVDNHANTSTTYGIRTIPTLLLFKKGQVYDKIIGAALKTDIQKLIDHCLSESLPK